MKIFDLNLLKQIRVLDAYPKIEEDCTDKTYTGAAVSLISAILISILIFFECEDYFSAHISEELFVDTSRNPHMQINLDIIIPFISCDFIALDAMDSSGEQHLQIHHNIYKRKLDLTGKPIEEPKKEETLGATLKATGYNKTECGSCWGAGLTSDQCCNTCEDVREAYRQKRWAFPENPENITQCQNEHYSEKLKNAFTEGCQIYGSLTVNRVSGSFHIAPGQSFSINHVHVHDVQPFSSTAFNTSHRIRHLTFGKSIDSATTNPLQDTFVIAEEGATMFQYHIKIVPTTYVKRDGSMLNTNQFSVTRHQKKISVMSGESGMPGAFFSYELSPLMVKYTEKERSFGHFATNLCAIIGGICTVAGLIDTLLYHSIRVLEKKIELGKLS